MAFMPVVSLSSGPYVIVNVELSSGICYFGSFIKLLTNAANRPLFSQRRRGFSFNRDWDHTTCRPTRFVYRTLTLKDLLIGLKSQHLS